MRKIKEINADIQALTKVYKAAKAELRAEAQRTREAQAKAKASKIEARAWDSLVRQAIAENKEFDRAAKAQVILAKAQARAAKLVKAPHRVEVGQELGA
jgi:hypothetical protein